MEALRKIKHKEISISINFNFVLIFLIVLDCLIIIINIKNFLNSKINNLAFFLTQIHTYKPIFQINRKILNLILIIKQNMKLLNSLIILKKLELLLWWIFLKSKIFFHAIKRISFYCDQVFDKS